MVRRIVGVSMLPTLQAGRLVLGVKFLRPKVGQVVIAEYDGREIIKRISQLGPEGVYVVGDNAAHSTDSRAFGWLPLDSIKSIVIGRTS